MKTRTCRPVLMALLCLGLTSIARADSYIAFETKRFYSANAEYSVEVKPDKRATLYRMNPQPSQIWSRVLPVLPARLFVSNDGKRVVIIDHYYGNVGKASAKVVLFFDEAGKQIAGHELGKVAALSSVLRTISSAHWYYGTLFSPDEQTLIVETVKQKCQQMSYTTRTPEDRALVERCWRSDPHEELRFSMATGALISRADISGKYDDEEIRLLHELEFVLEEHPPSALQLGYLVSELGKFYRKQKQYSKAKDYYEQAIQVYSRRLGADSDFAANAMVEAITVYDEYAKLLREQKRVGEAEKMERRASELRRTQKGTRITK